MDQGGDRPALEGVPDIAMAVGPLPRQGDERIPSPQTRESMDTWRIGISQGGRRPLSASARSARVIP